MNEMPELDARIAAGDMQAYGEFFELSKEVLLKYIWSKVGIQEEAEDILSETFLKGLQ